MASRVLKGETARALPPVEWREMTASGADTRRRPAALAAAPGSGAPTPPSPDTSQIEKQAYERGRRDGEAAGARQAREQLQEAIQGWARQAAELANHKSRLRAEAERELVELALAVARKIVRRELAVDPHIVLAVLRSALEELRQVEIYRLRVHPQDAPEVTAFLGDHRQAAVEVVPDSQVARGGAVFETARGQLDAHLDTQFAEIERGLADR